MGIKSTVVCDYPLDSDEPMSDRGCPEPGRISVEIAVATRIFRGDYCKKHAEKLQIRLQEVGMSPVSITNNSKIRAAYTGKSGLPFSGEEARAWLMENGYQVKPRGRLSVELLEIYADGH